VAAAIPIAAFAAGPQPTPEPGPWNASVYGGVYLPDRDVVDTAATYGVRIGHPFALNFVASGALGFANLDGRRTRDGVTADGNFDLTLVDGEIGYVVNPGRRFALTTAVGVGWAFVDGKVKFSDAEGLTGRSNEDDSFTASFSVGPLVKLTERVSLRVVSRWRWFEARKDDEIDQEVIAALVFGLGR
jgi:hypothetical protein